MSMYRVFSGIAPLNTRPLGTPKTEPSSQRGLPAPPWPDASLFLPSAGVGRTGTLIALDVLLRQLECEGLVGPFGYVKKMRESRPLMVQTEVRGIPGLGWVGAWAGRAGPRLRRAPPALLCSQAQYVFLHQCILQFLQQSATVRAQKGATYENLLMENGAATEA